MVWKFECNILLCSVSNTSKIMLKPLQSHRILMAAGMFLISAATIIKHYMPLPDFVYGFITGSAIGMLLIALIKLSTAGKRKVDGFVKQ